MFCASAWLPAGGLCQGKVPGALWPSGPVGPAWCCARSSAHQTPKAEPWRETALAWVLVQN